MTNHDVHADESECDMSNRGRRTRIESLCNLETFLRVSYPNSTCATGASEVNMPFQVLF